MPIMVQYGGSTALGLAGQAGAQAGKAQKDAALRQILLEGVNRGAQIASRAYEIERNSQENERQREFQTERDSRQMEFNQTLRQDTLNAQAEQRAADREIRQQQVDQTKFYQDALIQDRTEQRRIQESNARTSRLKVFTDLFGTMTKEAGRAKALEAKRTDANNAKALMTEAWDGQFKDEATGEIDQEDPLYLMGKARIMSEGSLPKEWIEASPGFQRTQGKDYQKMPASVEAFKPLARTNPTMALKVYMQQGHDEVNNPTGPTENAAMMGSAIATLANDAEFVGPDGYGRFRSLVEQYRAAGGPPEVIAPLESRLRQMTEARKQLILPKVNDEIQRTLPQIPVTSPEFNTLATQAIKAALTRFNVTPEEFREWAKMKRNALQAAERGIRMPTEEPAPDQSGLDASPQADPQMQTQPQRPQQ